MRPSPPNHDPLGNPLMFPQDCVPLSMTQPTPSISPITGAPQDWSPGFSLESQPFLGPCSLRSVHTPAYTSAPPPGLRGPCPPLRAVCTSSDPWPRGHSPTAQTHRGTSSGVRPCPSRLSPQTQDSRAASALPPRSTAPTDLPQAPSGSAPPFFVVPPPLSPRENRGAVGSGRRDPRADRAPSGRRGATVVKATGGPRAGRRHEAGSGGWEAGWEGACVRGPAPAALQRSWV